MTLEQRLAAYVAHVRAKYTQAEVDDLGAKGEALKDDAGDHYSYPIADEEDLKNAILAVGRGNADHDSIRAYIIKRAKALNLSDLIPDNWNSDGSLADEAKAAKWDTEHRDAALSYGDLQEALSTAVAAEFQGKNEWSWVADFTDDWVVYELDGETFQVDYTFDGTTVTFGKPSAVRTVTSYVPLESKSGEPFAHTRDDEPAGPSPEDPGIAALLQQARLVLAQVHGAQLADSDNGTDPVDAEVLANITAAEAALDKAIVAQAKDGTVTPPSTDDLTNPAKAKTPKEAKSMVPATVKRSFWSLTERPVPVSNIEVRMDAGEGTDPTIANFRGYASTTGTAYAVTDWLGEYRETIEPGAFGKTLREQGDVPLLFNHDGIPLASTGSQTSRLSEDASGLLNEAILDRSDGNTNTICVQLKRGVLNKMSFSFRAVRDEWNDRYDERSVSELALFDTSIVTYPANPTTSAELRSAFQEALGREGVGIMFSARAALAGLIETRTLDDAAEPVLEQAVRAIAAADEVMCRRSAGPYVRSRTFLVAGLLEHVRAGKVLSAKNQQLLQTAADALASASKSHAKTAAQQQKASDALSQVFPDGTGANDGQGTGPNPISPSDGAGPRSAVPSSVALAKRQLAELRLR